MFVGILGCTYALYFPKNSYFKGIIELILQITLIINGLFLSRVGVVYIYSPLMVRPTETKGQEGQILTLREANPGPQSGLRLMLAPKLGVDFIALAVTKYRKVASSNTSCLEAHAGFFRLLMKGIFDPYVL